MAPNTFVFPPPPPPPPQTSYQPDSTYPFNQSRTFSGYQNSHDGGWRGRGQRNGLRGSNFPQGGWNQRRNHWNQSPQQQQNARSPFVSPQGIPAPFQFGPRPLHSDASRGGIRRERATAPRAPAPPAVPRFGLPIPLKPVAGPEVLTTIKKRKRVHNQLGLTPKQEEHESSEEDVDEEERLARSLGIAGKGQLGLQFTYKGRSSTLNSASDLAAWLVERKKQYPTKARAEEERLRKAKQQEEARLIRKAEDERKREEKEQEALRIARTRVEESVKKKQQKQNANEAPKLNREDKAIQKAEKLRQKYEKAQNKVARMTARNIGHENPLRDSTKFEEKVDDLIIASYAAEGSNTGALLTPTSQSFSPAIVPKEIVFEPMEGKNGRANALETTDDIGPIRQGDSAPNDMNSLDSSDSSSLDSESEDSSEISSSDGDDSSDPDTAPETLSSKVPVKALAEAPKPPPPKKMKNEICRSYLKNGRCRLRGRCLYRHELPERGTRLREEQRQQLKDEKSARTRAKVPRTSLYQRMVLQEEEEEKQRILDHIIYLGEQGLLEGDGKS